MFSVSRILSRGHRPSLRPLVRLVHASASAPPLGREGSVGKHPFDLGEGPPPTSTGGGGGKRDKMRDGPADPIAGPSGRPREAESVEPQPEPLMEQSVQTPPADEPPPSPCPSPSPSPEELTPAAALPTPTVLPSRLQAAHPFDTFAFVSRLGANDVSPTTSRTLMEAVRSMIIHRTEIAQTRMLSREEMDNDAYRFKAALSDIRTGHSMRSRRDGVALRSAASATRREVDGLEQKIKEDIGVLSIEIETNNRKDETRSDMKRFDIAREEINNKFTISLGDLRTEIEGAKWDATRRAIAIIVTLVVIGVVVSTMGSKPAPVPVPAQAKATMLDVAVGTDNEDHIREAEEELDRLLSKVDQKRRREAAQRRHDAVGRI